MTKYQLTKTLRFGLTKVRKEKKHLSHEELDELVMLSEYKLIKKNVLELLKKKEEGKSNVSFSELDKRFEEIVKIEDRDQRNTEYVEFLNEFFKDKSPILESNPEETLFKEIKKIYDDIDQYIRAWEQVCTKTHLIRISKDYYKNLSKKAFYEIAKITTPEIPLSSLRGKNNYGVTVGKAISEYWLKTIRKASFFFNDFFKSEYEKMKNALNDKSLSHTKINLVDFRKAFLSLCSLVDDSLLYLVNGSILINGSSNENDKEVVDDFISNESLNKRAKLYDTIRDIKTLIKTEGGNTLLGRATLNPYTALQKPNLFSEKLKESAQDSDQEKRDKKDLNKFLVQIKLFLNEILNDLKPLLANNDSKVDNKKELYRILFADKVNKISQMNDKDLSAVQRAQYFKFKQIPASVRFILANYLSEQFDYDFTETSALFRIIGVPISPAEDYKTLKDAGNESEFSLDGYPLKVAFDYAWELCAKNVYEKVDFPQKECERFLKENFGIDVAKVDVSEKFNAKLRQVQTAIKSLSNTKRKETAIEKWISIYNNLSTIDKALGDSANSIKDLIVKNYPQKTPSFSCSQWLNNKCKQTFDSIKNNIKESDDAEFIWYAKLLWLNSCIVALEHFNANPPDDSTINRWKNKLNTIFGKDCVELSNEQLKNIAIIKNWIVEYQQQADKKGWIESKGWNEKDSVKSYEAAKIFFGKQRGDQKTEALKKIKIENEDITEVFKRIASDFGKNFATIRDGLREEYELNKIQYGSVIIEDKNGDRYLLLQDKNVNKNENGEISHLDIFETESKGNLKLYQVKSLTSKTVKKIVAPTKNHDVKKIVASKKNYYDFFEDTENNVFDYPIKTNKKYNFFTDEGKKQYDTDLTKVIIQSLTQSKFAIKEQLCEFKWNEALELCQTTDQLYKIIDQKGYVLKQSSINLSDLKELIDKKGCFLLPIVNQDITAEEPSNNNQFTNDWGAIFDTKKKDYRLHPEFTLFYRLPTPNYPKPSEKRYSRFQLNCNFGLEVIPSDGEYTNKKEQLESFKTPEKQKENVKKFNENLKLNAPYIIGIDRGINELATLCVTDSNGKIIGDFDIYKREFDEVEQCQKYTKIGKRNILDLSNLRVERDAKKNFYLVDLSASKVWIDSLDHSKGQRDNNQIVKLKELYYTRQFVYHLQSKPDDIQREFNSLDQDKKAFDSTNTNPDEHFTFKSELIIPFKCGNAFEHYPFKAIEEIIEKYKELEAEEKVDEIRKYYELDASYELKKGIVANMIGVVTYIFKEICHRNARIVLENLCSAWSIQNNALTGAKLQSTLENSSVDFKDQENSRLAGVGTYSMFEVQLLKKLFKLQIEDCANYVPAFRSVDDYEKAIQKLTKKKGSKKPGVYQFGIVCFVSPASTSHKCPICGASGNSKIFRHKESNDELECKICGYYSITDKIEKKSLFDNGHFVDDKIEKFYTDSNLRMIESGDDNAAYQIAVKVLKYFSDEKDEHSFFNRIQALQRKLNKDLDEDEKESDVAEESEYASETGSKPQKMKGKNGFNKQGNYSNRNRNNNHK